jgi:hypothetical protein
MADGLRVSASWDLVFFKPVPAMPGHVVELPCDRGSTFGLRPTALSDGMMRSLSVSVENL